MSVLCVCVCFVEISKRDHNEIGMDRILVVTVRSFGMIVPVIRGMSSMVVSALIGY